MENDDYFRRSHQESLPITDRQIEFLEVYLRTFFVIIILLLY